MELCWELSIRQEINSWCLQQAIDHGTDCCVAAAEFKCISSGGQSHQVTSLEDSCWKPRLSSSDE